jgi:hypothetical protein
MHGATLSPESFTARPPDTCRAKCKASRFAGFSLYCVLAICAFSILHNTFKVVVHYSSQDGSHLFHLEVSNAV